MKSSEEEDNYYYDSDFERHERRRQPSRKDGIMDPNNKIPKVSVANDDGKIRLTLWQSFANYKSFGVILKDYAIQQGLEIIKLKNERIRVTTMCAANFCT